MMRGIVVSTAVALGVLVGCAQRLKLNPPQTLAVAVDQKHDYAVGLYADSELKEQVHTIATSPFDKLSFSIGEQTVVLFRQNLPTVFRSVEDVESALPGSDVSLVLQPSIVSFTPVLPHPAYKPYVATIVFKVDVLDGKGEKIFTQTATGEGQTSKGMMSGFKAKSLMAKATEMAMNEAMTQILEGLADADELGIEAIAPHS
jgi:hypothetical protein